MIFCNSITILPAEIMNLMKFTEGFVQFCSPLCNLLRREMLTVSTLGCIPSVWFIFKGLKMDLTEGSETSANINQKLGIHPKVDTVNTEHSESLKSRKRNVL
jgi:hypothetical protein